MSRTHVGMASALLGIAALTLATPAWAFPPGRSMTISDGSASYSQGQATATGSGQIQARGGDSCPASYIKLKWDGALLSMASEADVLVDEELALWTWGATSSAFSTSTGNHKLGARTVVVDSQQVEHVVEVPSTGELTVNCS